MLRHVGKLRLVPEAQRPKPTGRRRGDGVEPFAWKGTEATGARGQVPGALYVPAPDGGPPPGFTHLWLPPALRVRPTVPHRAVHLARTRC
jgi:hypothetical protein